MIITKHTNKTSLIIKNHKLQYYNEVTKKYRKNVHTIRQIINTHIHNFNEDFNSTRLQLNELNNFFVSLGIEAIKIIKTKNSVKKYLHNKVAQSFSIEAITLIEIIIVTN